MVRRVSSLKVILSLVVLSAFLTAFRFNPPSHAATDYDSFAEAYYYLMRLFIHPLKSDDLIRGAVKGMDVALTHQKIPHTVPQANLTENAEENLEAFRQAFENLQSQLPAKFSSEDLMTAALRGMFESTGDPYTTYLTPKDHRLLNEQMNGGNFGGVGIYIELEKDTKQLMILEPIEETPAWKAGLKAGDYIMKIDGKPTKGIDLDVAQHLIRGPRGSRVTLTIRRKGVAGDHDYVISRDTIHVKSISYDLKDEEIGYIRIRTFGQFTGDELERALQDLERRGARAYVIDLRNNGGGYIDAARSVCSKFLPRGANVTTVVERNGHVQREVADGSQHPDYPLAVLVNQFTASASEITAGAVQDYKRGKIIGTPTFGKGSVQSIVLLRNRGAAKITISHYLTPNGRDIDKKGITPDIRVDMKGHVFGKSDDEQLKKAISLLKEALSARKAQI